MKKNITYLESVHRDGKIWGFTLLALILAFPLALSLIFDAVPEWKAFSRAILSVLPMYWAVGVIEIFTYIPMLGAGGSYLSFVTGNISNLKLPCALDAMQKANVKANSEEGEISNLKLPCAVDAMERAKVSPSSEEGEIISTIAIAVSSIVTTLIIAVGVILMLVTNLGTLLESEVLKPAFDQLLPALFGGLAVVFVSQNFKLAIAPMVLMLSLFIFTPLTSGEVGIMAPVGVIFTLIVARIMYKKGMLK